MSEDLNHKGEEAERDPVWDLLSKNASPYSVTPSPWFAARTAAKARGIPQSHSYLFGIHQLRRWLLPIPLAGVACLMFLTLHHPATLKSFPTIPTTASSEEEFEQHMALLAESDQSAPVDLFSTSR
jgi:hypothetical protein